MPRCVVMGLGNMLMTDDGLGLAALERLRAGWALPDDVELVDGGTWGMQLLPTIESTDRLLLIDAINLGAEPGTTIVLRNEEIPRYFAVKLSPHQIDLRETLAVAELRGTLPREVVAVGLQPAVVEMGTALSPTLAARMDALMDAVAGELARWGIACGPREALDATPEMEPACTR
jgi:hydrogenase maturation protease